MPRLEGALMKDSCLTSLLERPSFLFACAGLLAAVLGPADPLRAQGADDPSDAVFDDGALPVISITIDPAFLDSLYADGNQLDDIEYPARFTFESPILTATTDSIGFRLRGNTSRCTLSASTLVVVTTSCPRSCTTSTAAGLMTSSICAMVTWKVRACRRLRVSK